MKTAELQRLMPTAAVLLALFDILVTMLVFTCIPGACEIGPLASTLMISLGTHTGFILSAIISPLLIYIFTASIIKVINYLLSDDTFSRREATLFIFTLITSAYALLFSHQVFLLLTGRALFHEIYYLFTSALVIFIIGWLIFVKRSVQYNPAKNYTTGKIPKIKTI